MVEIDEDYDIMNEDKSKEGHKDRLEFVKARTAARDDIGLFTFGFETKYYPRPTVDDREYLAKLIQKMEMYKESDPNTWTLDREMISTEAIVYLAGLKIISKFCEPLLLE
uniref:Uncharacterized protein n=1 Tax=Panagrolaimus sp. JU765 TaxID=591449 RepID=A0AC34Q3H1_9BILA